MLDTIKLQTQVFYGQFKASFNDAHLACRSNFLPGSMAPQEKLKRDLEDLSRSLTTDGFELALPATRTSTYYSFTISSFYVFTTENCRDSKGTYQAERGQMEARRVFAFTFRLAELHLLHVGQGSVCDGLQGGGCTDDSGIQEPHLDFACWLVK